VGEQIFGILLDLKEQTGEKNLRWKDHYSMPFRDEKVMVIGNYPLILVMYGVLIN